MHCLLLRMLVGFFFSLGVSKTFCTDRSLLHFLPKTALEEKGVCAVHLARLLRGVTAEVWAVRLTISVLLCQYLTTFLPHHIFRAPQALVPTHACVTG